MASSTQPRSCNVTKQEGKGFGFYLRIEKGEVGHLIRSIEPSSSAEKSGLKDGDRLLRVNGKFVDDKEHAEVVTMIKDSGTTVSLVVLDKIAYENAKKKGDDLSKLDQNSNQPAKQPEAPQPAGQPLANGGKAMARRPRLCYLVKEGNSSYGFSLKTTKTESGIFLSALVPNGAAVKAGVKDEDHIIEVNGENVENSTHEKLAKTLKESGGRIMFLLSDKETDEYFKSQKMKITADKANVDLLPSKPRTVELKKDTNGYGFYLRQEKNRKGHFIMEIDSGSPAQKAKLQDYDRIVAVNGECVEGTEHEEVVKAIQKGGDKTTLLIVDKKTDEMYTLAGVSPYLFLQETQGEIKSNIKEEPTPVPAVIPSQKPATTTPTIAPAPIAAVEPKKPETPAVPANDQQHKPRLCKLQKSNNGYGFHLNAIKDTQGQFMNQVVKGGPADVAGIKDKDVLLEVNGANVEKESYEDVLIKIKETKGTLALLVASQEAYDYFKEQKIPITASMADPVSEVSPNSNVVEPASKARAAPEPIEMQSNQKPVETPKEKEEEKEEQEEGDTNL
ncbi:Na(+)/H(+) exchange regulatory cofactor NHE-RF3 isoform X1 [Xenopus laevis]|nr:Na(+)/H(+) exchange regulatory cofactor NHE-RF3 isoform X1 [Xenopus laevis]